MPLDYINHPEITVTRSTERDIKSHFLNKYDLIFLQRPTSEAQLNIIKLAKDLKKTVIVDYDDDTLHVPKENPMHGTYEGDKPNTIKCLALADEVWVATEGIKNSFRFYNKNIHVIPNALDDYIFPVEDKPYFKYNKVALWRGGFSHLADIYAPDTAEWLVKLINSNKKWQFHFWGQKFEWIEYRVKHGNHFTHPGSSTIQFYKQMHKLNACVFMYPLRTDLFNGSKSNCSWLEATYSGAAYFGNTELPQFQKDGIMPLSAMPELMKDADRLEYEHNASWMYIQKHLLLSEVNKVRIGRFEKYVK